MEDDEEALLAQAIALSMQENVDTDMADASAESTTVAAPPAAAAPAPAAADASAADIDIAMSDPDFLNSLLAGVPGAEAAQIDVSADNKTGTLAMAVQHIDEWLTYHSRLYAILCCLFSSELAR